MISWSISAVISCAKAAMISASMSMPCCACASCAASKVHLADSFLDLASTGCFKIWIDNLFPGVPSREAVEAAFGVELSWLPEYAFAILNGDKASSPAVVFDATESLYLILKVWICPTGPVIGCTPTISLAITVGNTRLITGSMTLFNVATLPADVAPAVDCSERYLLVFSKITSIVFFLLPLKPSVNAAFVSPHFDSNSSDI